MAPDTRPPTQWRHFAIAGYAIIVLTFGVAGGWAAVAKVDQAVVAPAVVAVENNRKTLQHFEGGIVRDILVKDGEQVAEGQVLFRLEKVQAQANNDLLQSQLDSSQALEARLLAEREGKDDITWPASLAQRRDLPQVQRLMADQLGQFQDRRGSLNGQIKVMEAKIDQVKTEIGGIAIEKQSMERQVAYINEELVNLRRLLQSQLVPATRVFAMERERTRLEGAIGKAISDSARAEGQVAEINVQIRQMKQKFQEEVATALLEVRQKISDYRERSTVAKDVLKRIEIVSPRAGTIQNLKVFTLGQVIRSGEPLLDIVPQDEPLIVQAQFSPNDIDTVHAGAEAEIRFPSFHSRQLPLMVGKLQFVSRDRLVDEAQRTQYYLGVVAINKSDIPEEYRSRIRPGMPAEVIVTAGERTVLNYLVSPLTESLRKTFIEK